MNQARTQKSKTLGGLSWAVALVLLWLQVGVCGFVALRRVPHAASLPATVGFTASALPTVVADHADCFCRMCKGAKKKSCCCAPKAGTARPGCVLTERCDGAASPDAVAAGSPLPLTVLPTLAARPLPSTSAEHARFFAACVARSPMGRAPTPPHAPPRFLS